MSFVPNTRIADGYALGFPHQVGPLRKSWDPTTRGLMHEWTLRVAAENWAPEAIDTAGPEGGNLVAESIPRHAGCGMLEWDQTFLFLPPPRTVLESIVYPIQGFTTTAPIDIAELPYATTASVIYDYFHTTNVATVPVLHAWRAVKVGASIYFIGVKPTPGQSIVAADSQVRQLRGLFYERKTPYITLASLTLNT